MNTPSMEGFYQILYATDIDILLGCNSSAQPRDHQYVMTQMYAEDIVSNFFFEDPVPASRQNSTPADPMNAIK